MSLSRKSVRRGQTNWAFTGTIIFVAVVLIGVVFGGLVYKDEISKQFSNTTLVPVKGKVLFRGKPLPNAGMQAYRIDGESALSVASTDANGEFEFETQVGNNYEKGLLTGEYKITIGRFMQPVGPIPPRRLSPEVYTALESTPLVVDTAKVNGPIEFVLEDDANTPSDEEIQKALTEKPRQFSDPRGGAGGPPGGGAGPGRGGPGRGGPGGPGGRPQTEGEEGEKKAADTSTETKPAEEGSEKKEATETPNPTETSKEGEGEKKESTEPAPMPTETPETKPEVKPEDKPSEPAPATTDPTSPPPPATNPQPDDISGK